LRQVHFWREGEGTRGGQLPLNILCSHLEASTLAHLTYYSRFYHKEHNYFFVRDACKKNLAVS
jgi:hypothetical protein